MACSTTTGCVWLQSQTRFQATLFIIIIIIVITIIIKVHETYGKVTITGSQLEIFKNRICRSELFLSLILFLGSSIKEIYTRPGAEQRLNPYLLIEQMEVFDKVSYDLVDKAQCGLDARATSWVRIAQNMSFIPVWRQSPDAGPQPPRKLSMTWMQYREQAL